MKRHSVYCVIFLLFSATTFAQTFNACDGKLWVIEKGTGTDFYLSWIDGYATGATVSGRQCQFGNINKNALGGNPLDGYIYFQSGGALYRLTNACVATKVCTPSPGIGVNGGFDSWGRYCYVSGSSIYTIDPQTCALVKKIDVTGLSGTLDISFNPGTCNYYLTGGSLNSTQTGIVVDTLGNVVSTFNDIGGCGTAVGIDDRVYSVGGSQGLLALNPYTGAINLYPNNIPDVLAGQCDMASFPCANIDADFTFNVPSGCGASALNVPFTDNSSPDPKYWSWNFGDPASGSSNTATLKNPTHSFSSPGTYTVTLTSTIFKGSCYVSPQSTLTKVVAVGGANTLSVSASASNAGCGLSNGSATAAIVSGGTSPFTYSWNTSPAQTTQTATGLSAGTYTVTAADAMGCSGTTTAVVGTTPSSATLSVSYSQANCIAADGAATVTASGGTGPFSYQWSPGGQTAATATMLTAGTYTVVVTDGGGCTKSSIVVVTSATTLTVAVNGFNPSCIGNNGSATAVASTGQPPYSYQWSGSISTLATASGLSQGNYTVTVTDSNGCVAEDTVSLTITSSSLTASASGAPSQCLSATGTATATASSGPTPYTYSWTTSPVQTTATATALSPGAYTVTVTDADGCTKTATALVSSLNGPQVSITLTPATCGSANGTATANVSGGASPYTYSWSTSPTQTSATATALAPGTYTVTVTDNNNCKGSNAANISDNSVLITSVELGADTILCFGKSLILDAGNTGIAVSYNWSTGALTQTISPTLTGRYNVTVNGPCNSKSDSVFVQFKTCDILVPNVFSPVGDGINDYFVIQGILDHPDSRIEIYNRWGQKIYESNNYQNTWDGRHYKTLNRLNEGVYYYILYVSNGDTLHGFVTLLRGYKF